MSDPIRRRILKDSLIDILVVCEKNQRITEIDSQKFIDPINIKSQQLSFCTFSIFKLSKFRY